MTAYFPGITHGIPISVQKISSDADLAVMARNLSGLNLKLFSLDDSPSAAISGESVVLDRVSDGRGRHSGAQRRRRRSLHRREHERRCQEPDDRTRPPRPDSTDQLIYDAQTTNGGSGGLLFNAQGKVIAVNGAMLRDFGGSNFALP
jgi:serine protease Do